MMYLLSLYAAFSLLILASTPADDSPIREEVKDERFINDKL
jgi:hypothetical protein